MKPLAHISTPWHYHFQRWLGRTLTPAERAVISPLERNRCHRDNRPAIVIDPPGQDTRQLLKAYLLYRIGTRQGLLMLPKLKGEAIKSKNIRLGTLRRPDSIRGQTVHSAVVIGYRHRGPKGLRRLISALLPTTCADGLLIIHADRLPRTLPEAFLILRPIPAVPEQSTSPPPVPVQGAPLPAKEPTIDNSPFPIPNYRPHRRPLRYAVLRVPKTNRTASAH